LTAQRRRINVLPMTGPGEGRRRRESPVRRVMRWLFAGREHIEQEGLLAERTLLGAPRRAQPEQEAAVPEEPDRRGGERLP
jgi:hypothetical protein